eukprot:CAMPEP_0198730880 /NCGR_PEP_ID=MMETSP1475-20131203/26882_1 /TAXON_ID= ORGANISM="Unidentified sp., Strain CCMP1999" /NCGR_SAMPLE_ID=MMETSP1475 /ASSEMBLY_ACC=CAM_ASM_001111 /LENGTH=561 /DNA_ID=CAMNT_0044493751 /DNA_START=350 /DNA_END=2035 /DNA_ORIENTATION=+
MVPYRNPSESYPFFEAVPWPVECVPDKKEYHKMQLGELLQGDRLVNTGMKVQFGVNTTKANLCTGTLSEEDVDRFRDAIASEYHYDLLIDELPIKLVALGQMLVDGAPEDVNQIAMFTSLYFNITYRDDTILQVDVAVGEQQVLESGRSMQLSLNYTVVWSEANLPVSWRVERYREQDRLRSHELKTHWLSVINSIGTVIVLMMFMLTIFFRSVRRDFARYVDDLEDDDLDFEDIVAGDDERGWKIVKADVFRFPKYKELFCAIVASGTQVLALAVLLLLISLTGAHYSRSRGSLNSVVLFSYALTSCIAGYTSAKLYAQMDGKNYALNVLMCSLAFSGPVFLVWLILDITAAFYGSTMALPMSVVFTVLAVALLLAFPATVIGAVLGRRAGASGFRAPVRTSKIRREIPKPPLYLRNYMQMLMAGLLPFGAVLVEIVYVFSTIWGHKTYSVNSVLVIVLVIVVIVTAFVCIAIAYYQLCAEDYEWWWSSFLNGGATGVYLFVYSLYYLMAQSDLSGFLQVAYFLGYMFTISYAFFLMLGMVGYRATVVFLRHMYRSVKCD